MSNFASFLQGKPLQSASTVNKTMNMFMDVLGSLPKHIAEEVFRDTLQWKSYNIMMSTVPKRHPQSYKMLINVHGIKGLFLVGHKFYRVCNLGNVTEEEI